MCMADMYISYTFVSDKFVANMCVADIFVGDTFIGQNRGVSLRTLAYTGEDAHYVMIRHGPNLYYATSNFTAAQQMR